MRQSPGRDRAIALVLQAEDAPQPTNRVDLDPDVRDLDGLPVARVTYQNHAFELAARDFYSPKLVEILGASGARWAGIAPADTIPGSAHVMGTLRFGADPTTSVCDADGRFHDVGNLLCGRRRAVPHVERLQPDDDHRGARDARGGGDGLAGVARERARLRRGNVRAPPAVLRSMIKLLLWLLLFFLCWPLALLALVLYPLLWLLLLPFRLVGITVDGVFELVKAVVMLPARLLGGRREVKRLHS